MILLTFCIVVLGLSIIAIVIGNNKDIEGLMVMGWIIGVMDVVFGLGLSCCLNPNYKLEHRVEFTYAKTESYVTIELNDNNVRSSVTMTDAYTYNNIDSTTIATSYTEYNVYGFKCGGGYYFSFITDKKLKDKQITKPNP